MKIAYLGPEGSYCHLALREFYPNAAALQPCKTITETVLALQNNQVDAAIVPIENSSNGVVTETLDALIAYDVTIIGEIILPIHHYLWGKQSNGPASHIYGHPQALAQCQHMLRTQFPDIEEIAVTSTALGAQKVQETGQGWAIGSALAGELYQLDCIASHIEDAKQNQTRFLILGTTKPQPTGGDKTAFLALNIPNQPGALLKLLEPFAKHGLNISLPSLRPIADSPWHYVFYFELAGHQQEAKVQAALTELQNFTKIKRLGSYPSAQGIST